MSKQTPEEAEAATLKATNDCYYKWGQEDMLKRVIEHLDQGSGFSVDFPTYNGHEVSRAIAQQLKAWQ